MIMGVHGNGFTQGLSHVYEVRLEMGLEMYVGGHGGRAHGVFAQFDSLRFRLSGSRVEGFIPPNPRLLNPKP